jgi:hypothetical protein
VVRTVVLGRKQPEAQPRQRRGNQQCQQPHPTEARSLSSQGDASDSEPAGRVPAALKLAITPGPARPGYYGPRPRRRHAAMADVPLSGGVLVADSVLQYRL